MGERVVEVGLVVVGSVAWWALFSMIGLEMEGGKDE